MEIALIGKPSSGKSTLFSAMTENDAEIASHPFTTIEPNRGVAYFRTKCPCKEFRVSCSPKYGTCKDGVRYIPIELWDVAGLVPDAHLGKGLGNQFLDDLSRASAFIMVVDMSGELDSFGNPGKGAPWEEIEWLFSELSHWIAGIIEKNWRKIEIKMKQGELVPALSKQLSGLKFSEDEIEKALKKTEFSKESLLTFSDTLRKMRPVVIAGNKMDKKKSEGNLKICREKFPGLRFVPTYGEGELVLKRAKKAGLLEFKDKTFRIKDATPPQKKALERVKEVYEKMGGKTGVQDLIDAVVSELNLIVAYPVYDDTHLSDKDGNVLPDAFLLPEGTGVKEFAYKIHTDIGERFLYAKDARKKMKVSQDYVVKDGDVLKIVSSA